jgi:hypothetical protein
MSTNFFSRRDVCFSSEICMQNCTEYAIASLSIKYDDNITTKVEQSGNPVMGCLGYIQFDCKERAKVYWAMVSSVSKAEAKVPDNMGFISEFPWCITNFFPFLKKRW